MRYQRRGGGEWIVAPDGTEIISTNRPEPDGTLVIALARALRWRVLLDAGVYASGAELEAEGPQRKATSAASEISFLTVLAGMLAPQTQISRK